MLDIQPDIQIVEPDDLLMFDAVLYSKKLIELSLVSLWRLDHNQMPKSYRLWSCPHSYHTRLSQAKIVAHSLRSRGRNFRIRHVPGLRMSFGKHEVIITIECRTNLHDFAKLPATQTDTVVMLDEYRPKLPIIASDSYLGCRSFIFAQIKNAVMLSSVCFARPYLSYEPWENEPALCHLSTFSGGGMGFITCEDHLRIFSEGVEQVIYSKAKQELHNILRDNDLGS